MSGLRQASAEAELKPLAELLDDIHRRIAGGATVPPLLCFVFVSCCRVRCDPLDAMLKRVARGANCCPFVLLSMPCHFCLCGYENACSVRRDSASC
jgi:hypothetical protein